MNLAVSYATNDPALEAQRGSKRGSHHYLFDKNLQITNKFDARNNIYLHINNISHQTTFGLKTTEFYGIHYSLTDGHGKWLCAKNAFCYDTAGNCQKSGLFGPSIIIDGYLLEYRADEDYRLIFQLKLIDVKGAKQRCYVTSIDGQEYILTFGPAQQQLILSKKILPNDSLYGPNNICFVTDQQNLYENLRMLALPAYQTNQQYLFSLAEWQEMYNSAVKANLYIR